MTSKWARWRLKSPASPLFTQPVTGKFPAQMASNAEIVSIWWRQHEWGENRYCHVGFTVWLQSSFFFTRSFSLSYQKRPIARPLGRVMWRLLWAQIDMYFCVFVARNLCNIVGYYPVCVMTESCSINVWCWTKPCGLVQHENKSQEIQPCNRDHIWDDNYYWSRCLWEYLTALLRPNPRNCSSGSQVDKCVYCSVHPDKKLLANEAPWLMYIC